MISSHKILNFNYFPFLKQLITKGVVRWVTPETKGKEKLVTTLYLDGDMLCWLLEDESGKPFDIPNEVKQSHLQKIESDLRTVDILSNHISLAVAFFITILTFALNPQGWLENLIIISGITIVGFFTRKYIKLFLFKWVGKLLRVVIRKV